ncbi:ectoine synthase [Pseudonocardia xishanensis]|uniref:L-ectoine synthase n=1 Tax=Pseudonocardia xishanensis TaxID=630995 RepID=A0ABP8RKH6_9PSEU
MQVRRIDDVTNTRNHVDTPGWYSRRIVTAHDRVGFSVGETVLRAGSVNDFWYANHVEAVYIVSGEGELYDKVNDTTYELAPGTMYLLDGHEKHQVRPKTDITCVCVFNPPVVGTEVHDENGVYPLLELPPEPAGQA